ncbi:unnamed protein product [Bursaphelenchus xylophilus]|uniref:(pine wood nematode) hypothetical protein n=1 Tax=Bursaphelenchus xylophilus TaxID=6326 RepID=A0A1I7S148_BURXY|nr:unnamed protein product [Bursaphelenchus xylophilus]CAG9079970.1 unnamed protein product [Bursaphelenchus xylophilus]
MGVVEDLQEILNYRSIKLHPEQEFQIDFAVFDHLPGWLFRYADIDVAANLWDVYRKWKNAEERDKDVSISAGVFSQHDGLAKKLLMINLLHTVENAQKSTGFCRILLSELQKVRQHHFQDARDKSVSTSSFALERFLAFNTLMKLFATSNVDIWDIGIARLGQSILRVLDDIWSGLGSQLLDIEHDGEIYIPTKIQQIYGTFLAHFQAILQAMVEDYDDILDCSQCLSQSHCEFHDKTMKRFPRLPLLVKDMIIEKLDGSDLASLRACSQQALYLIDTNFRSKFIDHSVYQRAVHFVDSQTVEWRNEYPSRHTKDEYSQLSASTFSRISHLYPVHSLRGLPKSLPQLEFCLSSRLEQIDVNLHSMQDFREAILNLFVNSEFFIFVQRIVVHADDFIFDEEMPTPPGFEVQCAKPFLMIYQRNGRQTFEMMF